MYDRVMDFPKLNLGDFGRRKEPDDDPFGLITKEVQDKLDEANRAMKDVDLILHPKIKTEKPPWKDDLYAYRITTKWPHLDWNPKIPDIEPADSFNNEYSKNWEHNDDSFKNTQMDIPPPSIPNTKYSPMYVYTIPLLCMIPMIVILLVFIVIYCVRKRNMKPIGATVLPNGRVLAPGPVQQNQQMTPMMPPGQGGAVPPNVPYSDNFNRPYSDEPPPYPTDADLQVNNSRINGIGFRNEVAPMPSAPPPYSDNSEPVESLNFGLNKERAGQGIRNADEKERVKYVDEKSVHK